MNLFHKSHSAGLPPVTECSLPHKVVHFILHSSDNHLKCFPLKFSKYLHFSFHSPAQFQPALPHRLSSIPLSHKCLSSQQRMQPQLLRLRLPPSLCFRVVGQRGDGFPTAVHLASGRRAGGGQMCLAWTLICESPVTGPTCQIKPTPALSRRAAGM